MAAVQKSFCGRIIKMKSIDIEENIYGQDESQCFGNGQYVSGMRVAEFDFLDKALALNKPLPLRRLRFNLQFFFTNISGF